MPDKEELRKRLADQARAVLGNRRKKRAKAKAKSANASHNLLSRPDPWCTEPVQQQAETEKDAKQEGKGQEGETTAKLDELRVPSARLEELTLDDLRAKMRAAMALAGLNQRQIGELMGYTNRAAQNVQELLTSSNPSILLVDRFARACGKSLQFLLSIPVTQNTSESS